MKSRFIFLFLIPFFLISCGKEASPVSTPITKSEPIPQSTEKQSSKPEENKKIWKFHEIIDGKVSFYFWGEKVTIPDADANTF